jgi:hypothetical protein
MFAWRDRWGQFRELKGLFFGRFLENDLICVDGDTRGTLIGILSLLIAPGLFLPLLEYIMFSSYPLGFGPWWHRDLAAVPDKIMHVALSMTVLGLMTVFEWDAILPDRRDVAVLSPLPVSLGTLFGAKLAALAKFWLVFTLAVDLAPAILFPAAVVQKAPDGILAWYMLCHSLSLLAANVFVFLTMVAIQGWLMTILGLRRFRRVAPFAQFVLIVGLLCLFFLSIGLAFGLDGNDPTPALLRVLPAWWFLGMGQVALGWRMPLFDGLAPLALPAIAIAAAAAASGYALSYRRSIFRSFEEQDGPAGEPGRVARLLAAAMNRWLVRTPSERASFYFVWHTVMRSRSHRLLVAAWAGAGTALVFQGIAGAMAGGFHGWWQDPAGPLLPAPIVLPLLLITGLRYAFTVPSDLRSNWLFQMGCGNPSEYLAGARKAALLLTLAPLACVLLPVHLVLWGWIIGGLHVLFGIVMAAVLVEAQMAGLDKLPFTCSYVPGKANVKSWWTIYVTAYLIYVGGLCWLDLKILERPWLFVPFAVGAAGALWGIREYRRRRFNPDFRLVYDERPVPAVLTLELPG